MMFSVMNEPRGDASHVWVSIESESYFTYDPFCCDFGPLSLLSIHHFVQCASDLLKSHRNWIHFYCSSDPQNLTNAVLLLLSFRIIHMRLSPDEAFAPFSRISSCLKPFRDSSSAPSSYDLSAYSCIRGLHRAVACHWYDIANFDADSWAHDEILANGGMNWIIPGKVLACSSPSDSGLISPSELAKQFNAIGMTHLIRLSKTQYNASVFTQEGISLAELFFADGSVPSPEIVRKFLDIVKAPNIVAVHCNAGLGRTGTLIACHLIKNYGFSANEAIGWIRICRPGSIVGRQQHFLVRYETFQCQETNRVRASVPTRTLLTPQRIQPQRELFATLIVPPRLTGQENGTVVQSPVKPTIVSQKQNQAKPACVRTKSAQMTQTSETRRCVWGENLWLDRETVESDQERMHLALR
jgi:cell division cycle 14